MSDIITPNDFGVVGESDSKSIQNAINKAKAEGKGQVVIPKRNIRTNADIWVIDEVILLPDNMTLLLDDCLLQYADGVFCNMFRNSNAYLDIGKTLSGEQKNISIIGRGNARLDGGEPNGLTEKTSGKDGYPHIANNNFILFANVSDFVIENVKFTNQRWWAVNFYYCRFGKLRNLEFEAKGDLLNQDGIDCRCGCNNIEIENISGQAGDDLIALTALHGKKEIEFAVEGKSEDIHSFKIRNVKGTSVEMSIVALRNQDGVKLYDIDIDGIEDTSPESGCHPYAALRIGQNNYIHDRASILGETYNISAKNITAFCGTSVMIASTLLNAKFENIKVGGISPCVLSVNDGATVENVAVDGVYYDVDDFRQFARVSNDGDVWRNDCGKSFAVFNFNNYGNPLFEGRDYTRNFTVKNVFVKKLSGRPFVFAKGDADVDFFNVEIEKCEAENTVVLEDGAEVDL